MFKLFDKIIKKKTQSTKTRQDSTVAVSFDDCGITMKQHGAEHGSVQWRDIRLIAISIEDDFLPFPYWYIGCKDNLLRIPSDAIGASELFFDGFSKYIDGYAKDETFQVILEASSAMQGSFIVWQAADASAGE